VRLATFAVSVLSLVACTSETQLPRPRPYIKQGHPKAVWIERVDGSKVQVHEPQMVGDTIAGKTDQGADIKVPMKDVDGVSLHHIDWALTDALVGAVAIVTVFALLQVYDNNDTTTTPVPTR
jgi:hypothetical protein